MISGRGGACDIWQFKPIADFAETRFEDNDIPRSMSLGNGSTTTLNGA